MMRVKKWIANTLLASTLVGCGGQDGETSQVSSRLGEETWIALTKIFDPRITLRMVTDACKQFYEAEFQPEVQIRARRTKCWLRTSDFHPEKLKNAAPHQGKMFRAIAAPNRTFGDFYPVLVHEMMIAGGIKVQFEARFVPDAVFNMIEQHHGVYCKTRDQKEESCQFHTMPERPKIAPKY